MNVWLLGLISLFTDISSEMVYPLIPLFLTTTLGASPAVLGLVEGTVESVTALVKTPGTVPFVTLSAYRVTISLSDNRVAAMA